jgi:hypothetical protein
VSDGRRLTIRRLEPGDDRSGLDSGQIELDRFFQRFAGQNQFRHHLGVTYVAMPLPTAGMVELAVMALRRDSAGPDPNRAGGDAPNRR